MFFLCLIIATGFGACMVLGYTEAIPAGEQKRRRGKQHLTTGMDFIQALIVTSCVFPS